MKRLTTFVALSFLTAAFAIAQSPTPLPSSAGTAYAVKAGRLIDPETGSAASNQVIVVRDGRITAIGSNVSIPHDAEVIDLSQLTVMPGMVDAHTHLAMTMKRGQDNALYAAYITQSTALRAIEAASNGMQMLSAGFTVVRDMGNAALYADTALRQAIEGGWIPGPTVINAGAIIGPRGGQFSPTPEMELQHHIVEPEYLEADTPDEIVKAIHRNLLFGAKLIKVCVDCKPYGYSLDDLKIFVREATNAGVHVAGHVQTEEGARRAIEAGFWSIEHDTALTDAVHKLMAEHHTWRVGTEAPFTSNEGSQAAFDRTVAGIKDAYANHVQMAFSTDISSYVPGMTRGERAITYLQPWKASGLPNAEVLKILTINGYKVAGIYDQRGPIKVGFPADFIAVKGNPLEGLDALKQVVFVMKDGLVFKRDGVMTPEKFLHGGPVNGWNLP
ncbi:MAG TPA: amidohydrolase family protein [Candidatus Koribacter sp.]